MLTRRFLKNVANCRIFYQLFYDSTSARIETHVFVKIVLLNNIHVMGQKMAKILGLHPYLGIAFWLITWHFLPNFKKKDILVIRRPVATSTAPTSLVLTLFRNFDIKTWRFWKNAVLNSAFFENAPCSF